MKGNVANVVNVVSVTVPMMLVENVKVTSVRIFYLIVNRVVCHVHSSIFVVFLHG